MHNNSKKAACLSGIVLFVALFLIYAAFPSQQRNFDGPLQDIQAITTGTSNTGSRHFLYTYIGVPYYRLWRALGYTADAAQPMLLLNAFCAVIGICGFYVFLRHLELDVFWAVLLALVYAFSYGYWTFTTDVFYNTFATVPLLWSLPVLLKVSHVSLSRKRVGLSFVLAVLGVLAILATQEHILFVLVVIIGLLTSQIPVTLKARLTSVAVYLGVLLILLMPLYILRAIQVNHCVNVRCVVTWLRPYGELIPMYQTFAWDRIPAAAWSLLATIVPLWRGMALQELARGVITPAKILPQWALLFTVLVFGSTGITLLLQYKTVWKQYRYLLILCIAWLSIYIPPIIWLDPYGPERWIVPLAPILTLIAVAISLQKISEKGSRRIIVSVFSVVVVATIASANFAQEIWPNYKIPNRNIAAAQIAAGQMGIDDIIISPRWDWTLYLEVQNRKAIGLVDLSMRIAGQEPDSRKLLASLDSHIQEAKTNGGRVFLVDVFSYTPADWIWIEQNTGLRPEHFDKYPRVAAWQFEGEQIWEILSLAQN